MEVLILGGDSKLSKFLENNLLIQNIKYTKTSRRNTSNSIYLNFENIDEFIIPDKITHAVVVGGVTSYDDCENKYEYAHKINCVNIPKLIRKLLNKNIFVLFISTNTVFKYNTLPKESDLPSPAFPYAKLKHISENKIKQIAINENKLNNISILRLTKNVCENTPPFNDWILKINNNQSFNAFKDLYFAPITFNHSSKAIIQILINKYDGIFHLSGDKDVSYAEFALGLLKFLDTYKAHCNCISSYDLGIKLKYNHHITALDMKISSKKLKIEPISSEQIYEYLIKFIKQ